ncbi:hypothetical protein CR205_13330 [Alteribacter lacisalsi]|uniref:Enoyl-CoA hydratase n=1 Tax=Alteribacter lacisalsi TaxID=2045244 RepID=A0A2W0H7G5_9BACI|nr:enoyl-CoA hydratase-related protein [Alteribacter lacisalsi]PYZ96676.1 hypothetical protein CR205_13330 [Alteribacter lacisalsi]
MSEQKKDLILTKEGSIATIVINRAEKRNALTHEMWKDLPDLLNDVEEDENIKVLIVSGAGKQAFAAGADISEFNTLRASAEGARVYNEATQNAEKKLEQLSKPTIAMIQGFCVGGGLEIALACDFRFTSDTGVFGITPAKIGIIYNLAGTKKLVDLVGPARAKDILFSGRMLDAEEAYEIGLVERLYAESELTEKTYDYANLLASRAQNSIRGLKRVITEVEYGAVVESKEIEDLILQSFDSDEYLEGVKAFQEKRKPVFK